MVTSLVCAYLEQLEGYLAQFNLLSCCLDWCYY